MESVSPDRGSEYRADAVIHILGVSASVLAAFALSFYALRQSSAHVTIPTLAYCFGLVSTFVFSAAYNMTTSHEPRKFLRKLDRSAIFIMIAGTYTPLGLIGIGGEWGPYLTGINWSIAIIGVISTLFFAKRFERVSLLLYLFQGGLVLGALKPMYETLSPFAYTMILLGALIYGTGVIFYRRDDWKFNRAIWHAFVLSAATIHYFAILDIVSYT